MPGRWVAVGLQIASASIFNGQSGGLTEIENVIHQLPLLLTRLPRRQPKRRARLGGFGSSWVGGHSKGWAEGESGRGSEECAREGGGHESQSLLMLWWIEGTNMLAVVILRAIYTVPGAGIVSRKDSVDIANRSVMSTRITGIGARTADVTRTSARVNICHRIS